MFRYPSVVVGLPDVPIYTFPLATLGTVNFTAIPCGTSDVAETLVHEVAL